jgi:predicted PhzF superfamily epimerase YddE/YHI9
MSNPPEPKPQKNRSFFKVDIFTPSGELPFAGHPTLGSCHVWVGGESVMCVRGQVSL